jgi:hypothetical protein
LVICVLIVVMFDASVLDNAWYPTGNLLAPFSSRVDGANAL